jgi:hypothetical protein
LIRLKRISIRAESNRRRESSGWDDEALDIDLVLMAKSNELERAGSRVAAPIERL